MGVYKALEIKQGLWYNIAVSKMVLRGPRGLSMENKFKVGDVVRVIYKFSQYPQTALNGATGTITDRVMPGVVRVRIKDKIYTLYDTSIEPINGIERALRCLKSAKE